MQPDTVDLRALVDRVCREAVASHLASELVKDPATLSQTLAHTMSQKLSHELVSHLRRQTLEGDDEDERPFLIVPWKEEV